MKKFRPKHDKDKDDVKSQIAIQEGKRKGPDSVDVPPAKKPKKDSWGFINFNPPRPIGEDDASINEHVKWLKVCYHSMKHLQH